MRRNRTVYAINRYYSPDTGRFTTHDPLTEIERPERLNQPQGLNLYPYVMGAPTRYTDPDGLDWAYNSVKGLVIHLGPGYGDPEKRAEYEGKDGWEILPDDYKLDATYAWGSWRPYRGHFVRLGAAGNVEKLEETPRAIEDRLRKAQQQELFDWYMQNGFTNPEFRFFGNFVIGFAKRPFQIVGGIVDAVGDAKKRGEEVPSGFKAEMTVAIYDGAKRQLYYAVVPEAMLVDLGSEVWEDLATSKNADELAQKLGGYGFDLVAAEAGGRLFSKLKLPRRRVLRGIGDLAASSRQASGVVSWLNAAGRRSRSLRLFRRASSSALKILLTKATRRPGMSIRKPVSLSSLMTSRRR